MPNTAVFCSPLISFIIIIIIIIIIISLFCFRAYLNLLPVRSLDAFEYKTKSYLIEKFVHEEIPFVKTQDF